MYFMRSCVKACPKNIIELRKKGPKSRRVFVSCVNKDKGGVAKKACANACIGCGKCAKECPFEAITVENNVAYIDYNKMSLMPQVRSRMSDRRHPRIELPAT